MQPQIIGAEPIRASNTAVDIRSKRAWEVPVARPILFEQADDRRLAVAEQTQGAMRFACPDRLDSSTTGGGRNAASDGVQCCIEQAQIRFRCNQNAIFAGGRL